MSGKKIKGKGIKVQHRLPREMACCVGFLVMGLVMCLAFTCLSYEILEEEGSWSIPILDRIYSNLKKNQNKLKKLKKKGNLVGMRKVSYNKKKPLNIVLLYADDMRHDSLGIANNDFVKTPFLDSLARRGIRFTNNCVTTSICWMSRATLHTGLYASQHKGWMPDRPLWYKKWYKSFPYLMKKVQNYALAHVGKWDYLGFNQYRSLYGTYFFSRIYHAFHWYSIDEVEEDVKNQTEKTGQTRYKNNYKTNPETNEVHATDRVLHDAMLFLEHRPKQQPFMMTVSFFPPHSVDEEEEQYFPQPETASSYENVTIDPPVPPEFDVSSMTESYGRLPNSIFAEKGNEARRRWHLRFDEKTKYSTMMRNYYRLITGVDTACKTIVEELERQGIVNETLIIFTTDNGMYHGEHGMAGKWFPHEESIRTPLIILDPRAPASSTGTIVDEFTLNIDLAPTLLKAAEIPIPDTMQGRDISELYLSNKANSLTYSQPWRKEFYYEHPQFWDEIFLPASTALVRKTHKYIQWGEEKRIEQLFHLTKDPHEEEDVSQRPEYAEILHEMRRRHYELQQECCEGGWNVSRSVTNLTAAH